jgi:hypothetical protein
LLVLLKGLNFINNIGKYGYHEILIYNQQAIAGYLCECIFRQRRKSPQSLCSRGSWNRGITVAEAAAVEGEPTEGGDVVVMRIMATWNVGDPWVSWQGWSWI